MSSPPFQFFFWLRPVRKCVLFSLVKDHVLLTNLAFRRTKIITIQLPDVTSFFSMAVAVHPRNRRQLVCTTRSPTTFNDVRTRIIVCISRSDILSVYNRETQILFLHPVMENHYRFDHFHSFLFACVDAASQHWPPLSQNSKRVF